MPLLRLEIIKRAALAAAMLIAALSPRLASATLGEQEGTVQSDVAQANATVAQDAAKVNSDGTSGASSAQTTADQANLNAARWLAKRLRCVRAYRQRW